MSPRPILDVPKSLDSRPEVPNPHTCVPMSPSPCPCPTFMHSLTNCLWANLSFALDNTVSSDMGWLLHFHTLANVLDLKELFIRDVIMRNVAGKLSLSLLYLWCKIIITCEKNCLNQSIFSRWYLFVKLFYFLVRQRQKNPPNFP